VLCRWQVCALNLTGVHVFYFIYFLIFLNKYSWNLQLYNIYKYIYPRINLALILSDGRRVDFTECSASKR
jgi:hypothetical protein